MGEFLSRSIESLRPSGALMFTTHGRIADMLTRRGDPILGPLVNLKNLCENYARNGFAYQDYDSAYPVYGLTFSLPSRIMRKIEQLSYAKVVHFIEGGGDIRMYSLCKSYLLRSEQLKVLYVVKRS